MRLQVRSVGIAALAIMVWLCPIVSSASGPALTRPRGPSGSQSRLSVSAEGAISKALGATEPGYEVRRVGPALAATNASQGFSSRFEDRGVVLTIGRQRVRLSLNAIGYGRALSAIRPARPRAEGNRVLYATPGVGEWYANGPLGLEQGFTVAVAPRRPTSSPLTIGLRLSGAPNAAVEHGGKGIRLSGALSYGGLWATGGGGRPLRSWMTLTGRRLLLHVAVRGARFPVTVDPFVQATKLTNSAGAAGDGLGTSVAISGDGSTVVVAADDQDDYEGAVYVFQRPTSGWGSATTATATLTAADGASNDYFGSSVSVSDDGSVIVASAPGADYQSSDGTGALYVFERTGGTWTSATQTAKLTLGPDSTGDTLASSAAISGDGDTIVAAGTYQSNDQTVGTAYVYESTSGWSTQTPKADLQVADPTADNGLGAAVAVSQTGTTIAVGGGAEVDDAASGAVYVFTGSGSSWTQSAVLTPSDPSDAEELGDNVAISADASTIISGAPFAKVGSVEGAVYVWSQTGGVWASGTQAAVLSASDATIVSLLGTSIGVSSNGAAIVAGDPQSFYGQEQGTVYLFLRPSGGWAASATQTQTQELTSSDGVYNDGLGTGAAISADGGTVAGGAPNAKVGDNAGQGAAYVWTGPLSASAAPVVTTGTTTVGETTATVNGTVDANSGTVTNCQFDYGVTDAYGSTAPCTQTVGSGSGPVAVSAGLTGLQTYTRYHYRIEATNRYGTSFGQDETLFTSGPPVSDLPIKQVIFVHGIRANCSQMGTVQGQGYGALFDTLLRAGMSMYTFCYYDDLARAGGPAPEDLPCWSDTSRGPAGDFDNYVPAADVTAPGAAYPLYVSSDQPGTSETNDGNGPMAYDAALLNSCLVQLVDYDISTYGHPLPIAIIGNSMGGGVTRGWLQLAQAQKSPALQAVTTVLFLEGAVEGSWIAAVGEGVDAGLSFGGSLNPVGQTIDGLALGIAASQGVDPGRPGVEDLAPGSYYYQSIIGAGPPPKLHYYALSVNENVVVKESLLYWTKTLGSTDFIGDGVIQLGQPAWNAMPAWGGSQFLPSGSAADQHQYVIQRSSTAQLTFDPEPSIDMQNPYADPYNHFNFGNYMGYENAQGQYSGDLKVKSCAANGATVYIPDEIARDFETPWDACGPGSHAAPAPRAASDGARAARAGEKAGPADRDRADRPVTVGAGGQPVVFRSLRGSDAVALYTARGAAQGELTLQLDGHTFAGSLPPKLARRGLIDLKLSIPVHEVGSDRAATVKATLHGTLRPASHFARIRIQISRPRVSATIDSPSLNRELARRTGRQAVGLLASGNVLGLARLLAPSLLGGASPAAVARTLQQQGIHIKSVTARGSGSAIWLPDGSPGWVLPVTAEASGHPTLRVDLVLAQINGSWKLLGSTG